VAAGQPQRREGAGREQSTAAREQPPLARDILHKTILANQAAFEQKLAEIMLTKQGALQVLELLAKLNREIGSRADEAPAVRIVIGGLTVWSSRTRGSSPRARRDRDRVTHRWRDLSGP
jgi:hypothetical protein